MIIGCLSILALAVIALYSILITVEKHRGHGSGAGTVGRGGTSERKASAGEAARVGAPAAPPGTSPQAGAGQTEEQRVNLRACLKHKNVYLMSGRLYYCLVGSNEPRPISPEEFVAELARDYSVFDRTDKEITARLVKTFGIQRISRLFAGQIGFDEKNGTYLGTIPAMLGHPESGVFRSRSSQDSYAVVYYIEGVPVSMEAYGATKLEYELRERLKSCGDSPERTTAREAIAAILKKEFPVSPEPLSAYRVPGTEEDLPPLPEALKERVSQLAEAFFPGQEPSLLEPSEDAPADKRLAMGRLLRFLAAVDHREFKFDPDYGFVRSSTGEPGMLLWEPGMLLGESGMLLGEPGMLRMVLSSFSSSCFDGGPYHDPDYTVWLVLERLDRDWDWVSERYGRSGYARRQLPAEPFYRGTLEGEDCLCAADILPRLRDRFSFDEKVFLREPFGLRGVYRLRIYKEYD